MPPPKMFHRYAGLRSRADPFDLSFRRPAIGDPPLIDLIGPTDSPLPLVIFSRSYTRRSTALRPPSRRIPGPARRVVSRRRQDGIAAVVCAIDVCESLSTCDFAEKQTTISLSPFIAETSRFIRDTIRYSRTVSKSKIVISPLTVHFKVT